MLAFLVSQSRCVKARRLSLKADLLCVFLLFFYTCYVFIFTACHALPALAQGLPGCQQGISGACALTPPKGQGLAACWHWSDTSSRAWRNCLCWETFAVVSFWLQLVVRTEAADEGCPSPAAGWDVLNQILVAACPQVSCHGCDMGTGLRAGKCCFPQQSLCRILPSLLAVKKK